MRLEKLTPVERSAERKFQRVSPAVLQTLEQRHERLRHRNAKGASPTPFGIRERDRSALEVEAVHRDAGFAEAASRVHGNKERNLHPLRRFGFIEFGQDRLELRVGDFRLLGWCILFEARPQQDVALAQSEANGPVEDHGEQFHIVDGAVSAHWLLWLFPAHGAARLAGLLHGFFGGAPLDIFGSVLKANGGSMAEPSFGEPELNPLPAEPVNLSCLLIGAMLLQESLYEAPPAIRPVVLVQLLGGARGTQFLCLGGLSPVVCPELRALVYSLAPEGGLEEPIRGASLAVEGGHIEWSKWSKLHFHAIPFYRKAKFQTAFQTTILQGARTRGFDSLPRLPEETAKSAVECSKSGFFPPPNRAENNFSGSKESVKSSEAPVDRGGNKLEPGGLPGSVGIWSAENLLKSAKEGPCMQPGRANPGSTSSGEVPPRNLLASNMDSFSGLEVRS